MHADASVPFNVNLLRALAENPADAGAYHDAAVQLRELGNAPAALRLLRRTHLIAPDNAGTRVTIANVYEDLGRYERALAILTDVHGRAPKLHLAQYRLGMLRFRFGHDDRAAWEEMEARSNNVRFQRSTDYPPSYTPWDGQQLPDRALVVYGEGGYGDVIAFTRFLPRAAALCGQVVFVLKFPLAKLVAESFAPIGNLLVNPTHPVLPVGGRLLAMSLPHALRDADPGIAVDGPYLRADPRLRARWLERLPPDGRQRVGVFWRTAVPGKSLPPELLAPLAIPGEVALCSLLPTPSAEERVALDTLGIRWFDDLAADAGSFAQTAGLIAGLDAVVTIDSAVAHLAGAMGVPTLLLLPFNGDWRWRRGPTTDWYTSIRIFRQPRAGAWAPAVAQAAAFLSSLRKGGAAAGGWP